MGLLFLAQKESLPSQAQVQRQQIGRIAKSQSVKKEKTVAHTRTLKLKNILPCGGNDQQRT